MYQKHDLGFLVDMIGGSKIMTKRIHIIFYKALVTRHYQLKYVGKKMY